MRGSDGHDFRSAASFPGADTRQWCSFGIVQDDPSGDKHSVRFTDDTGQPLPHGVLVDVKLEPSGIIVPCRVVMRTAGSGEAEWDPIGPGDEVFVGIAEGDERAGCVILGRLNNTKDVFPMLVAGQDTTNNSVVMRRYRAPYILESGTAIQIRNALTGSQVVLDPTGGVMINSSDKHALAMTAVGVTLALGDGDVSLQLDPSAHTAAIQAKGTSLLLGDKSSTFQSGGTITFQTAGAGGQGHGVTLEQLMSILANLLAALQSPPTPPTPYAAGSMLSLVAIDGVLAQALAGANLPSPFVGVGGVGGGIIGSLPLTFGVAGVGGALNLGLANPLPALDVTGLFPGIGRPGFML